MFHGNGFSIIENTKRLIKRKSIKMYSAILEYKLVSHREDKIVPIKLNTFNTVSLTLTYKSIDELEAAITNLQTSIGENSQMNYSFRDNFKAGLREILLWLKENKERMQSNNGGQLVEIYDSKYLRLKPSLMLIK